MLHLLGIGISQTWVNNLYFPPQVDSSYTYDDARYYYTGTAGFREYKNVLQSNGFTDAFMLNNLQGIPIEDDFGGGTAYYHFEEGLHEDYSSEVVLHNNGGTLSGYPKYIPHPTLSSEIMTGLLSIDVYITSMCLGVLEDRGFIVDYNSEFCVNQGLNLQIVYTHQIFTLNVTVTNTNIDLGEIPDYTMNGDHRGGSIVDQNNPTININVMDRLIFIYNNEDSTNHPFYIKNILSNGANNIIEDGSVIGQGGEIIEFNPTSEGTFYYQCGIHYGMNGEIIVSANLNS